MKRIAIVAVVTLVACAIHAGAAENVVRQKALRLYDPTASRGARLSQLVHEFQTHRHGPVDKRILFGQESHRFNGRSKDLNRFLEQVSRLPGDRVTVFLAGPDGDALVEPLTVTAAQTSVGWDWRVQTLLGEVSVCIPLANRIPFEKIRIPAHVRVEVTAGAPRAATVFAQLHNARLTRLREGGATHGERREAPSNQLSHVRVESA